ATPAGKVLPGLWNAARDNSPTRSFSPRSSAVPFEFEALPVRPMPEQTLKRLSVRARRVASRTAWRLLDRNRNLVRRTFLLLSTIPWLRRPAAVGEQTLAYVYRHGLRATF